MLEGSRDPVGAPECRGLVAYLVCQPCCRVGDEGFEAVLHQQIQGSGQEHEGEEDEKSFFVHHVVGNKRLTSPPPR